MRKLFLTPVAALLVIAFTIATAHAATDQNAQVTVVSGSDPMPLSEVQNLVGADWNGSVEQQTGVLSAPGTVSATDTRKHCYGGVYWKAGKNVVGLTLWKEWNHTAWCGYPYQRVVASSVGGHTDVYTSPAWDVQGAAWHKTADRHNNNAYWTDGSAQFAECFGPGCIGWQTVNTHMHIFANGVWNGS